MPNDRLISQRLQYNPNIPSFLLALQGKVSGKAPDEEGDDYGDEPEMEQLDVNRPAIPRRPRERASEDRNRADEDDGAETGDEKPTVVVLKEGKHLTEREAENERRKAQGLPPLPEPESKIEDKKLPGSPEDTRPHQGSSLKADSLSISSSSKVTISTGQQNLGVLGAKRKTPASRDEKPSKDSAKTKKKKKESKSLISFGNE
ncbi:uncharacterized protein EI90DRAFT_3117458 [Cantharellus anzutake]|uniref:uncharacterized protein n=1 Tax=Cantharellus anzutake TaxID=1750568 RepID=UPI001907BCF3|nr:uncharacterized protein EI90DRAFT_3117458 [Cantharellus anzutake]KAF8339663.1 hypothetical protein EI90DRAFT_3117458 [Cantharellus anzutake]